MSLLSFANQWFGKKAFNYGLKVLRKNHTSASHPEKYKARDGLAATEDAQALRQTNDIVSSYLTALSSGAIGEGLTLQYKSDSRELNKKVERWLEYWSESENCVVGGLFRQEAERNLIVEAAIKGGFLIRHRWDKRYKTLYKYEILSCDNIDRTKNDFAKNLYFGTQVNSIGEIDGMWLYDTANRMGSSYIKMNRGGTPQLTLYIDKWTDPHQYTNITTIAATLNSIDQLSAMTQSELKSADGRATKSVIIATPTYEIMLNAQKALLESSKLSEQDREKAQQEYMDMLNSFTPAGLHGEAIGVMPGSEVWDLKATGQSIYADLNLNSKRVISRALGLSASTVTGEPESSYNVALKNQQQDERYYAIKAQMLIEKALKIIYRNAIEAGFLLNEYDMANYYETRERLWNRYLKITRKRLGHIDPLKQNTGDATAVEFGFNSHITVISDQGRDFEDVIDDEVEYERIRKEKFEEAGLTYIQTGTDKIALEKAKQEIQTQDQQGN